MSDRPWSKFFWSDWESDEGLRQCSLAAQGLWMRMLCICAKGEPRGYLTIRGVPLDVDGVSTSVGRPKTEVAPLMAELEHWGVFSRDRKRRIYSRRMIRDEKRSKEGAKHVRKRWGQHTDKKEERAPPNRPPNRDPTPHMPEARVQNSSVPNGTDGPPADHDEMKAWAWREGVAWIAGHDGVKSETVKTFLGAHCRDFGALEVAQAMAGMWHEDMATPGQFVSIRPMLTARLKNGVPAETKSNGSAERVARVVQDIRDRDQEAVQDGAGANAPAVLPAVPGAGRG